MNCSKCGNPLMATNELDQDGNACAWYECDFCPKPKPECKDCYFYEVLYPVDYHSGGSGLCRRNPPVRFEGSVFGSYPEVEAGMWCGSWREQK